jgi:hypothetical protein
MTTVEKMLQELKEKFPKQMTDMYNSNQLLFEDIILKAKEMEKERIIGARYNGRQEFRDLGANYRNDEKYYNETYKSE